MSVKKIIRGTIAGILCCLCAQAAQAEDAGGTYKDDQMSVQLQPDGTGGYSGTIMLRDQRFPMKATLQDGKLRGTFTSQGKDFPMTGSLQDHRLTLETGGAIYQLNRAEINNPLAQAQAPAPANPLAQAPQNPLAQAQPPAGNGSVMNGYRVVTTTAAGQVMTIDRAGAGSVQSALEATLHDTSRYFDGKPTITGAFEDTKDHHSGGAAFTANYKGQPVKGIVSCKVTDRGATMTVVYCRTNASAEEWNKLTAATGAPADAPQLQTLTFADGTGSIGIAPGWKSDAQTCLQTVRIIGPADQRVSIGFTFVVQTPNSQAIRTQEQIAAQSRQMGMQPPPFPPMLVAPFTTPTEALTTLFPQLSQLSQRNGGPAMQLDKIMASQKINANLQNGRAEGMFFAVTHTTNGSNAKHYFSRANVELDPIGPDAYMVYITELAAPQETFDRDVPVMLAMVNSLKTNDRVIQQKTQQNIDASNQRFAQQQQAHRDLMETYDRYNKSWEHNQTIQARSNDNFIETIRGERTVEDTTTGYRSSVDLGNVDDVVNKLNEADPGRYKQIPLRDEMDPLPGGG